MGYSPSLLRCVVLVSLAALAGCGQNDVQVYRVAKETPASQPGGMPPGHPDTSGAGAASASAVPSLAWKLPEGWEEAPPGQMRVASFKAKGKDGKTADVGVFPLPGMAGKDLDNVNRWRGQVGQGPITEEELAKINEPVQIEGQPAQFYDLAGENPGSGEKTRILAAILRRDGVAWFFKMTGEDALVAQQKPAFVGFLKSLKFVTASQPELPPSHPPIDGSSMAAQGAAAPMANPNKPTWQVPAGWQEVSGGSFLIAKFTLSGSDNAQAAVNVSMSGGDGGGLAGNVNRWRKQLGLNELPDSEINKMVTSVEVPGGKAVLVDMTGADARTGQKARVLGAMVPRAGQTWFYKLMGSEQIVEREKDAFTKFIQTAKYPNAS